ncbi:MAG TPA: hypothetical protein PK156_19885, partial [Polyangium sp.]|nr:hypothetical protein [Polyangium sp.]
SPSPRVNVTPNERVSPSPQASNPLPVDVDVRAMASARTTPVEKVPTKSVRHQVAPLPLPPGESDQAVDWYDIWLKLRWPAQLMLLSLLIIAAELYYPRMTASALESVGVRPMWAAAVVATVALSWACVRLFLGR